MQLLSKESETVLVENLVELVDKRIVEVLERNYNRSPYANQKEIMSELGVSYAYFKKLEAQGLRRVKIDPNDKTIFYNRSEVYKLLDQLLEHA